MHPGTARGNACGAGRRRSDARAHVGTATHPLLSPVPRAGVGRNDHIGASAVSGPQHAGGRMGSGFRMTIGADPGEVARVGAAFAAFADAHALPASVRRSLHVALDELLINTITYGFAGRDGGEVTVDVELRADRVSVTLTDDGRPFDPLGMAAPDTTLPVEERRIGGLGVHLVRGMMDEVSYHRRADRNVVTLSKFLAEEAP